MRRCIISFALFLVVTGAVASGAGAQEVRPPTEVKPTAPLTEGTTPGKGTTIISKATVVAVVACGPIPPIRKFTQLGEGFSPNGARADAAQKAEDDCVAHQKVGGACTAPRRCVAAIGTHTFTEKPGFVRTLMEIDYDCTATCQ
jgi:hypothetical protein